MANNTWSFTVAVPYRVEETLRYILNIRPNWLQGDRESHVNHGFTPVFMKEYMWKTSGTFVFSPEITVARVTL